MSLLSFDFREKENLSVYANPLVRSSAAETFINCSNHLTAISISLTQHCGIDDEVKWVLAKQLDRAQHHLSVSEWPIPVSELETIRREVALLSFYNKKCAEQLGAQSISVRINKIVDALQAELDMI